MAMAMAFYCVVYSCFPDRSLAFALRWRGASALLLSWSTKRLDPSREALRLSG